MSRSEFEAASTAGAAKGGNTKPIGIVASCEDYGVTVRWSSGVPAVGTELFAHIAPQESTSEYSKVSSEHSAAVAGGAGTLPLYDAAYIHDGWQADASLYAKEADALTYGAQQREAGQQELLGIAKQQQQEIDALWKRVHDAEAALARQPVSEGLTREKVVELADEHSNGRSGSGRYLFGVSELMSFANALAVPPAKAEGMSDAARDVLAERQRQVNAEGWTPLHDDKYRLGELSMAAACYALIDNVHMHTEVPQFWPWLKEWWKPSDERRNLVKAGALILADIERIDRAILAQQAKKGNQQ